MNATEEFVKVISNIMELKDYYTFTHQKNVAGIAELVALELGMDKARIETLVLGARVHDVGKICLPSDILSKPGFVSQIEKQLLRTHVDIGRRIVTPNIDPIVEDIILHHHERINGSGYPHGLKGKQISLECMIVSATDTFETMTNARLYRTAIGVDFTLNFLDGTKDEDYDGEVVEIISSLATSGKIDRFIKTI